MQKPGFVYAPVVKGQNAGFAYVLVEDQAVGKIPIYYGDTVEQFKEESPGLWDRLFKGRKNDG